MPTGGRPAADSSSPSTWHSVSANWRLIRTLEPLLRRSDAGRAVFVTSGAATTILAYFGAYATSKAALDMLTQSAALELAPKKVRVNAVNPGVVVTNLHLAAGLDDTQYRAFLERSASTHPLGRPGTADEVAALATFLISDEAGWITGGLHSIDGGRALTSLR